MPTLHIEAQGGATVASRRPVPQETQMNLLSQDLSRARIPVGADAADAAGLRAADAAGLRAADAAELAAVDAVDPRAADVVELRAARVRALRRARREAQFRAARVSRALLAPSPRRPLD
ncbi:hypothetical protein AB0J52_00435 [Spirillospora sp. NPDC049652]